MANRHHQHIDSPAFKELAYRVLSRLTAEQKENFSPTELKAFSTDYLLQKFCKEERMDYLMYFMAKAGIDWTFRIHEDAVDADMVEFNSVEQYRYPLKRLDVTEATARNKVCIVSSRDVMIHSHLVAQNCATKVYAVSEFSKKLAEKGRDLKQLTSWDDEVVKAHAGHDLFNDLLLEQLNSFDYAEGMLGLELNDLRILCAMYKKRNTAIRLKEISDLTKSAGKKMYFRKQMQKLLDAGLVVSDGRDANRTWANSSYFVITTAGLDKVIKYRKYIYKQVFNLR